MTTQISPRDWEALSSYLDNQLSLSERNRFEIRLEREAELRRGLEELRRTRTIIRSARRYRAPRNFTLTPSMVDQKRASSPSSTAYPVLRLASVLATLFFVLITAGSFAAQRMQPAQMVAMSSELESARNAPAVGMGGAASQVEAPSAPALAPAPTLGVQSGEMSVEGSATEENTKEVTPPAPESATPAPEGLRAFAVPAETEASDLGTAEEPAAKVGVEPGAETEQPAGGANLFTFVIFIQAALLLLAVVTGILAYLARKNSFP